MPYFATVMNRLIDQRWILNSEVGVILTDDGRREAISRQGIATFTELSELDALVTRRIDSAITAAIDRVQSRIGEIEGRLSEVSDQLTDQLGLSEGLVTELESQVTQAQSVLSGQIDEAKAKLANLEDQLREEVERSAQTIKDLQDDLTAQLADANERVESLKTSVESSSREFRDAVSGVERESYARLIPLFALVISAFALLISGAQQASRLPDSPDPIRLFQSSLAIMMPVGFVVILLVTVAWCITRAGTTAACGYLDGWRPSWW